LLEVRVKPHEIFLRDGLNIISEVPLSITEAVLGCKITIETVDGKLNIEVKPGTNSGDELHLKHHGMPPFHPPENYDINDLRGDHIIKFKIVLPKDMSDNHREIIREF